MRKRPVNQVAPWSIRVQGLLLASVLVFVLPGRVAAELGGADGSFESGLTGVVATGEVRIVSSLGPLQPPQEQQALLLGTGPSEGSTPADADEATVTIADIDIPADVHTLRADVCFLTDEPAAAYTNDTFALLLHNQVSGAEHLLDQINTFAKLRSSPWTGYARQTGYVAIVADVSALAGTTDAYTLELRIVDQGDGRRNSAALVDNIRLVSSGTPVARVNGRMFATESGESIWLSGLESTDPDGTIAEYWWDFGDGRTGSGAAGLVEYTQEGFFQGSLTVTDDSGLSDTVVFQVQVGAANHAPSFSSTPVETAAAGTLYRYAVEATDPEMPYGDTLTFSLVDCPAGMTIDPVTGAITWLAPAGVVANHAVAVRVTDSEGLWAEQSFTLKTMLPRPFAALSDYSGTIYVSEHGEDGTWGDVRIVGAMTGHVYALGVADFNNDGLADIVTGAPADGQVTFHLFLNDGTNAFSCSDPVGVVTDGGAYLYGLAVGDVNHDGHMDFLANGGSKYVHRAIADGHGGFVVDSLDMGSSTGRGLALCDVNHDGHLDLLRATYSSGYITLFLGDGTGAFVEQGMVADAGSNPFGLVATDFDGDGHPDIAAVSSSNGVGHLFLGDGTGTFGTGTTIVDLPSYGGYGARDLNGDGNMDLVAASESERKAYFLAGDGAGGFADPVPLGSALTGTLAYGVAVLPAQPPARTPVAVITPDSLVAPAGTLVSLSGAGSTDDGAIVAYQWDFGDGTTAEGVDAQHFFPAGEARYTTRLTVTDDEGKQALAVADILMQGEPPTADTGGPYTFGEQFANGGVYTVPLSATGSSDDGVPPLRFLWDLGDSWTEDFSLPILPASRWTTLRAQIDGGKAVVSGTNSWGSAYAVATDPLPRRANASYRARVCQPSGSYPECIWGLKNGGTNYSYNGFVHGLYFRRGTLRVMETGNNRGNVATYQYDTWYDVRIDLRAWGAEYYIRPADSAAWEKLYESYNYSTSPLRVGVTVNRADVWIDDVVTPATSAVSAEPTVVYRGGTGVHSPELTVTDAVNQSAIAATTVTLLPGAPPHPDPGGPYTPGEDLADSNQWTVTFDALTPTHPSTDDVGIYRYDWDFGDGTTLADGGPTPVHVYDGTNPSTVSLTVYDHALQARTATTTVTPTPSNPPVARPGEPYVVDEHQANAGLWTVQLDGSASSDDGPNGIWQYDWDFGDDSSLPDGGPTPSHVYAAIGTYTVALTVRDHANQTHTATTTVEVRQNDPPVAIPGTSYLVDENDASYGRWTAVFSRNESRDDVGIWKYGWNFGDGATGDGEFPTHLYTAQGTYTVTLTVTDHAGQTDTATTQIVVRGNDQPVAYPGPNQVVEVGQPVELDASGSSDDFGVAWYNWAPLGNAPTSPIDATFPYGYHDSYFWAVAGTLPAEGLVLEGNSHAEQVHAVTNCTFGRQAGASFAGTVRVADASACTIYWGLKNNTANSSSSGFSYNRWPHGLRLYNGTMRVVEAGILRGDGVTLLSNTDYDLKIDLKDGAGATYYYRVHDDATWTQLYDSTYSGAAPFRFGLAVANGTVHVLRLASPAPLPLRDIPSRRAWMCYAEPGDYYPRLTVTDHALQATEEEVHIEVTLGAPPVANAGGPYLTNVGFPTRLNAALSTDDFAIAWYHWDFGDGESLVSRNPWADHTYLVADAHTATLTVTDYAGQADTALATVTVRPDPVAACVPWQFAGVGEVPHDTWSDREAVLKAVAWSGSLPLTCSWDFGDGTVQGAETVDDPFSIEARHTYTGVDGTPFVATLTVTDAEGRSASDRYLVRIRPKTMEIEANVAIDDGLWWLHKNMARYEFAIDEQASARLDAGYWTNRIDPTPDTYRDGPTGSALQAFAVNGHLEHRNLRDDPYAGTVRRALNDLASRLETSYLSVQAYGDPDSNANTIGIASSPASRFAYHHGMVMDGLVAAGATQVCPVTGPSGVRHRPREQILTEMVDLLAFAQDDNATRGGGWRYVPNDGTDNSAAQWTALGMVAAERVGNIDIPYWVKERLDLWLDYSNDGTGFGYTGPGNTRNLTPAGLALLAAVGRCGHDSPTIPGDERDPRWQSAEAHIEDNWAKSFWTTYSIYARFGFAKAMRIALPEPVEELAGTGLDWFGDPDVGLARAAIDRQETSGKWAADSYSGGASDGCSTIWHILLLSPTLFVQPPVADPGGDRVWGVDMPLTLDGSRSYHLDPFRTIVNYEWDLDGDGVFDTSGPTPQASTTWRADDYPDLPVTIAVSLRVTDDNAPPLTDTCTIDLTLAIPPRPPRADAGGPYQAVTGRPIALDGSGSEDIDPSDLIARYEWDLDGDYIFTDATGVSPTATFARAGTYSIGLRVWDNGVMNDLNGNGYVDDNERLSDIAYSTVTVRENQAPAATPQTVETPENIPLPIALSGTDPDGDVLTFAVTTQPQHGVLAGNAPDLTYTPAIDWYGNDSFAFTAADGLLVSPPAKVSITVTHVNAPPIATPQGLTTAEDTPIGFVLAGTDADADLLTFAVATQPQHGVLSGNAPDLTYTPSSDWHGDDSFTFTVHDGTVPSEPATVTITVTPVNDPPTSTPQALSTPEDTPIDLTLAGTDVDGDQLTFAVATPPQHGVLSGTAPDLTYTPDHNWHGADSFAFAANDGTADSEPATVAITVIPVNDPPAPTPQELTTEEDAPLGILLAGTDVEGDPLAFAIVDYPLNGTLSGTAPDLVYTPTPEWSGSDSFTFTVHDGTVASGPATVAITVTPVNDPPAAAPQQLTTEEDTPIDIVLTGTDPEGGQLTFTIAGPPLHGTVSGTPPDLTYTPSLDWSGSDSFTFTVHDGTAASEPATVAITVTPVNDPPTATPRQLTTEEDTPLNVILTGTDPEGEQLTFAIAGPPQHGTLSGTAPDLTYTPSLDWSGSDSFTFTVHDGTAASGPATVAIAVTPVNDPPTATPQQLTTEEDTPIDIVLTGTDPEGEQLTFAIVDPPQHGTLSGTAPDLVHTPAPDWYGDDSFAFTVHDGTAASGPATVAIAVTPVNDPPTATPQQLTTEEDTPLNIVLAGTDPEGEQLTFAIADPPQHGTLSGTVPDLVYTPALDWHGDDSFAFAAHDGTVASGPATVAITVTPVNDPPTAIPQELTTEEDTPVSIVLAGTDPEGGALTFAVVDQPLSGTLSGTAPDLVYTPNPDWSGADSFTFAVHDGALPSGAATVTITVSPVNDVPTATPQELTTEEDTPLDLLLAGEDIDADPLTFATASPPQHGTLDGIPPALVYTPETDWHGADSFTFTVHDGTATSSPATIVITVTAAIPPEATPQDLTTPEDTPVEIVLTGDYSPAATVVFVVVDAPQRGTLSGTPPDLVYTPDPGWHGTDSFTFTVDDGETVSEPATVTVTVGVSGVSVRVYRGWNLLSTPYFGCIPTQIFRDGRNDWVVGDLYRYRDGDYETVDKNSELVPGVGYWIYLRGIGPDGATVLLAGDEPTEEEKLVPLQEGWNLFGAHNVPEEARHVPGLPFGQLPLAWNAQQLVYVTEPEHLALGLGYWARVVDPAQIASLEPPTTGDIVVDYVANTLAVRLSGRFDQIRVALRERNGPIVLSSILVRPARNGDVWETTLVAPGLVQGHEYLLELLPSTSGLCTDLHVVCFRTTEPDAGQSSAPALVLLDALMANARYQWDGATMTVIVPEGAGCLVEIQTDTLHNGTFLPLTDAAAVLDEQHKTVIDLTTQPLGTLICVSLRLLNADGTPVSSWRTFTVTRGEE